MMVFMLGLFSSVGRWLRISRVRPLNRPLDPSVVLPPFLLTVAALEVHTIEEYLTQRFKKSFQFGIADNIDADAAFRALRAGNRVAGIAVNCSNSVVMLFCGHCFNLHSARARRQPPSVLDRTGKRQLQRQAA